MDWKQEKKNLNDVLLPKYEQLTRDGPQIIGHVTHQYVVTNIVRVFCSVKGFEHLASHGATVIPLDIRWKRHRYRGQFCRLRYAFVRWAALFQQFVTIPINIR